MVRQAAQSITDSAIEEAAQQGFLVLHPAGRRAHIAWWKHCKTERIPFVLCRLKPTFGTLQFDLSPIEEYCVFSADEHKRFGALLLQHVRAAESSRKAQASWGTSHGFISGVSHTQILQLARDVLALGSEAKERCYPGMTPEEIAAMAWERMRKGLKS